MSDYHLKPIISRSLESQEKKAARKKLLEEVRARRRENYKLFKQKLENAHTELVENRGY